MSTTSTPATSSARSQQLVRELLERAHQAIVDLDVSYEEFQAAKQWLIEVGEAGEWPLFLDVFVESAVERNDSRAREGSQGTILGPFHLPGAPVLEDPFQLPVRPDEAGDPLVITGQVLDTAGRPLTGARLDVWHADASGGYSGFDPSLPEGLLRGQVVAGADGRFTVRTVLPGPYTIPPTGPTRDFSVLGDWSPWRPAHVHMIVSADGHVPLITQLYIDSSPYLDSDVADAVKPDLIVHPEPTGTPGELGFSYTFRLAPTPGG